MSTVKADRSIYVGMLAVAVATAVLSFSALSGLAEMAGVKGEIWRFKLAWLLPVAIDAYAVTATRVWLMDQVTERTRKYARSNAVGAISLSVLGNGAYHYFAASGVVSVPSMHDGWMVVIAVSAVPPVMLGLVGHLHALLTADGRDKSAPREREWPRPPTVVAGGTLEPVDLPPSRGTEVLPDPPGVAPTRVVPVPLSERAAENDETNAAHSNGKSGRLPAPRSGKPSAETIMRDYWVRERAEGRTPSGVDLDRVAGTRDYGRKVRRTLLAEEITRPASEAQDSK